MFSFFDMLRNLGGGGGDLGSGGGLAGGAPFTGLNGLKQKFETVNPPNLRQGRAGPHAASGAYASPSARPPALQEPQGWQRSPGSPLRERAERFQDMMDREAQRYPDTFLKGFRRQLDQERHDQDQNLLRMMNQYRGWDI